MRVGGLEWRDLTDFSTRRCIEIMNGAHQDLSQCGGDEADDDRPDSHSDLRHRMTYRPLCDKPVPMVRTHEAFGSAERGPKLGSVTAAELLLASRSGSHYRQPALPEGSSRRGRCADPHMQTPARRRGAP